MKRAHVILPEFGYGFFSNYFRILTILVDVDKLGLMPWIDWTRTAFVEGYNPFTDPPPLGAENPWDLWFEQSPLADNDELVKIFYDCGKFNHDIKFWKREGLDDYKRAHDKYMILKDHIRQRINDIYEAEFKDKVILGVMARGCEMNHIHPERGNQTLGTWLAKTREVLGIHPEINRVFLVTEDGQFIPHFENIFDNIFYLKDVFRRTDESMEYMIKYALWPCISTKRENQCKLLGEETLIQAHLLSKCDYLVVKQCGVSSAAIFLAKDNLKDVYYT